ncbi:hypothetical protein [Dactylosporangium sp. CS-033363]|uniref:hypothetical protein n=1 Tax=Dactylosporangium sp. CS-033363 TaxID=3239935 RepID=UPI003D91D7CD
MLIVVDDADVYGDLAGLLTALYRLDDDQVVRVLLVARDFGDWWTALQQPLPAAVDLAEDDVRLGPIATDAAGQRAAEGQTRRRACAAGARSAGAAAVRG